jgi:hypothetical protein
VDREGVIAGLRDRVEADSADGVLQGGFKPAKAR